MTTKTTPTTAAGQPETPDSDDSGVIGYWDEGWETVTPPQGANMAIAFMGFSNITTALKDSAKLVDKMVGAKYLCLGGGNEAGGWSSQTIQAVIDSLDDVVGYDGLAFDIEVCEDQGLAPSFTEAFAKIKARNLSLLVTISHSEPYGCKDAPTLMQAFFNDPSIDYLSPQLYTTGKETQNDYTAVGTPWTAYAAAKSIVVPSLVRADMYADAQAYFKTQGVTLGGFIQWNNSAKS